MSTDNVNVLLAHLAGMPYGITSMVKKVMSEQTILEVSYVRENFMTGGTTENKLAVRSGMLRRGFRSAVPKIEGNRITGGINAGTQYAYSHIGVKGSIAVIKPKNAKALAMPVGQALTPAGVSRGGPRSGAYGKLSFVKNPKPGNLIGMLVGKRIITRRKNANSFSISEGKTKSGYAEPLFLLLKQVKIRRRISSAEISRRLMWRMSKAMQSENLVRYIVK